MNSCEQLKEIVDEYFDKFPHLSVNSLALKSGVGATTLRRIRNGSIKGDPAPHTILNILSAVTNEKRLEEIVNQSEGELEKILKSSFGTYIESGSQHEIQADLNIELTDSIKYFIYKSSANRVGSTSTWVSDNFGKLGLEKLEELKDVGLIEQEGKFIHAKNKNFSLDLFVATKHLPELVKFYQPEKLSDGKNLFYSLSESINFEAIKKIKEIEKEAVKKIFEVLNDEKSNGSIPYFSLIMSDTLNFEGKENES